MPIDKVRNPMPAQDPEVRKHNFNEVALGYSEETAIKEAQRCLMCKHENCVKGCPVQVPIPQFIKAVAEGNFQEGLDIIYKKNILPAICGRVCPQETQCELQCTLGKVPGSKSVAIGRLERFVSDWVRERKETSDSPPKMETTIESNGIKVAIIGSGPSGLTCASELAKKGYEVTVFEAFHKAGGVLVYGIPEFRLPKAIVQSEVDGLKKLGVKFSYNKLIGKIFTLDDLRELGYKAFFVGIGAGVPMFVKVEGLHLIGVTSANDLLSRTNLMKAYKFPEVDTPVMIGEKVAVLGGGNVAMDAARTLVRLGFIEVYIVYRRSVKEMPAREEEYHHAVEEGVKVLFQTTTVKIIGDENMQVSGLEVIKTELGEPDASGRRRPTRVPGTEYILPVDQVIFALGTNASEIFTKNTPDLKLNKWGYIEHNDKLQASIPDVFVGGDISGGSATVISAMGEGKIAAQSIIEYLEK